MIYGKRDGEKIRHFNKAFHSSGMDEKLRDLYQRIMQFEFDDGPVDLSFAQRLAVENGWSAAFSERVIHEYKRFIFLVANAGHPVTPSDQVDQAWHLHLTYTRSYWERLCHDVIGRPLHHTPTRGGSAELHKFDVWYRRTLASYHAIFAEPPPSDIWPEPAIRFGDDLYFKRVNTRRYWMIPKPRIVPRRLGIRLFSRAGILTTLGSAAPLVAASSHNDSSQSNGFPRWLPLLLVSILIVGVGILFERRCVVCKRLNALKKPAPWKYARTIKNGKSTIASIVLPAFGGRSIAVVAVAVVAVGVAAAKQLRRDKVCAGFATHIHTVNDSSTSW